jgi:hypothetical protein
LLGRVWEIIRDYPDLSSRLTKDRSLLINAIKYPACENALEYVEQVLRSYLEAAPNEAKEEKEHAPILRQLSETVAKCRQHTSERELAHSAAISAEDAKLEKEARGANFSHEEHLERHDTVAGLFRSCLDLVKSPAPPRPPKVEREQGQAPMVAAGGHSSDLLPSQQPGAPAPVENKPSSSLGKGVAMVSLAPLKTPPVAGAGPVGSLVQADAPASVVPAPPFIPVGGNKTAASGTNLALVEAPSPKPDGGPKQSAGSTEVVLDEAFWEKLTDAVYRVTNDCKSAMDTRDAEDALALMVRAAEAARRRLKNSAQAKAPPPKNCAELLEADLFPLAAAVKNKNEVGSTAAGEFLETCGSAKVLLTRLELDGGRFVEPNRVDGLDDRLQRG